MTPRPSRSHVSLERALSKLGVASRAQARALVSAGRVSLRGAITKNPLAWVDLARERIALDGKPLAKAAHVYLAMNKPAGVVTTRSDERGRRTVLDLLPDGLPPLFPVGRLDLDTSGLLLFTNDTRWANAITDPDAKIRKTYRVRLDAPPSPEQLDALRAPMTLPGGAAIRGAQLRALQGDPTVLEMTIDEGKNRQIRRACALVGLRVAELERVSIGGLRLGDLAPGATCRVDPNEVSSRRPTKPTKRT